MPRSKPSLPDHLSPEEAAVYRRAMQALADAHVPFLVSGAYAFACYTGIERSTKDFDLFVRRTDLERAQDVLQAAGFRTELPYPHWLAKAYDDPYFIDLIFRAANGLFEVDDAWFERAPTDTVLGVPVQLCPPEEILATRAFIMERERFDGADVAHLLRCEAVELDWDRMLALFGPHWRVLLSHLVLFGFIYPGHRDAIPAEVMQTLLGRLQGEIDRPASPEQLCQGTLLSRQQYLVDVQEHGYQDARLAPEGAMTREEVEIWTDAIPAPTPP
ncbi:MAG TPA: nucleotidyltransferase [Rhodothermales bacterium]|nr:nucleotidyltransferase [Rhodothermales bacterium]